MENQRETPKLEDFLEKGIPEDVALDAIKNWDSLPNNWKIRMRFKPSPEPALSPIEEFFGHGMYQCRPRSIYGASKFAPVDQLFPES